MSYFLYQANWITGKGGVCPRSESVPNSTLGIFYYGGYFLGSTTDVTELNNIANHNIIPISDTQGTGFQLLGLTELMVDPDDPESGTRALTTQEQDDQAAAQKLLDKLAVRQTVSSLVGDQAEIISDLAKRVGLLEMAVAAMLEDGAGATSASQDLKDGYASIASGRTGATYKDTIDVCGKTTPELFTELMDKTNQIATTLDSNYYNPA